MDALISLSQLAIVLVISLALVTLSNKLKISNVVLLIAAGMVIGALRYNGAPIFEVSEIFIEGFVMLALVIVLFDSGLRLRAKEFDTHTKKASLFAVVQFIITTLVISLILNLAFKFPLTQSVMLASLIAGTSISFIFMCYKKGRAVEIIRTEATINNLLLIVVSAVMLVLLKTNFNVMYSVQQVIFGLSSSLIVGIIFFKFMRKYYSEIMSPIALFTASLATYALAENMNGSGIIAIASLGFFFGHITVKNKEELLKFSSNLSNIFKIITFMLLGILVKINFDSDIVLKSIVVFIAYIITRTLAVNLSLFGDFHFKEKIFIALNSSKGAAVAVLILFSLSMISIPLSQIALLVLVYSAIISSIIPHLKLSD